MSTRIGVLGLGRMGGIFADRLVTAGFPVGVWNRTAAKCEPLVALGATSFATPAALAAGCDILLSSMAHESALAAVFEGEDGVLAADLSGRVVVETSTVRPAFIRDLAALVANAGGSLVDAPILGTVGPAREGRVVIVAGGSAAAIDRLRPALAAIGRKLMHMGPTGAGSTTKLVVNMHLATYWHSLAESVAMGCRSGLDLAAILDVLMDSPVATAALKGKLPRLLGESADIGFDIGGVRKDLIAALDLAGATGTDARTAAAALSGFTRAIDAGYRDRDVADIVRAVKSRDADG